MAGERRISKPQLEEGPNFSGAGSLKRFAKGSIFHRVDQVDTGRRSRRGRRVATRNASDGNGDRGVSWSHPGVIALISGFLAQAAKVVVELVFRQRWQPGLLFANGGMPSSHASTVTSLTFAVAAAEGVNSSIFSIVLIFSLFVIFEATGLRQEIGKQAQILNELMDSALHGERIRRERLRELVGHTWVEVIVGIIFGAAVYFWLGRL